MGGFAVQIGFPADLSLRSAHPIPAIIGKTESRIRHDSTKLPEQ
jgi:hypothetical protein